ncbi:chemotaxis protein CheB [Kribbella sp. NPDC004875]|uniref:chemotaxis protein CheB n=1 Tax=Kribbella sp. NPDC004875 TaxID=3364107 RepID=UPI003679AF13
MKLLTVGGSAGAVEAIQELAGGLPADLDAAVVVAIHISRFADSRLPAILSRSGPLPAVHGRDGDPLRPGSIVVAPPDHHLLVDGGIVQLSSGPRVNRHRPSVDVMFASAARRAGPSTVAVVLSGTLDDGALGATLVSRAGGRVLVEDPATAAWPGMPRAALAAAPAAAVRPLAGLAAEIVEAIETTPHWQPAPRAAETEGARTMGMADSDDLGFLAENESRLTRLVCPDCDGSLAQVDLDHISYFRCHVGHQFSPQSLAAAHAEASEARLWAAASALEEQAALRRHLASAGQAEPGPEQHLRAAERAAELSALLRDHLARDPDRR